MKLKRVIAIATVAATVFSFSGCLKFTSTSEFLFNGNSFDVTPGGNGTGDAFDINNLVPVNPDTNQGGTSQGGTSQGGTSQGGTSQGGTSQGGTSQGGTSQGGTSQGGTSQGGTSQGEQPGTQTIDPTTWTTAEILAYVTNAVTKTKAYTSTVTVNHQEAFNVQVTKAPGGQLVMQAADKIIQSVAKPSQETLTFNNGKTTNAEGETVPLLLPKRGAFTLTADGIASASASMNGDSVVCHIQLVKEVGTLTDHPKHHAASVGYLDASDVDLSGVTLNYLDITYTGTTIDMVINSDGYVSAVVYKIPIHIAVEGKIIGITASGECEGSQQESWQINW